MPTLSWGCEKRHESPAGSGWLCFYVSKRQRAVFLESVILSAMPSQHVKFHSRRLAVMIDGDSIDPADFGRVFAWAADRGEVVVRRIYGNPKNLSDWKKCIDKHGIEPVGNYADGRNAADFAMTIDALDILHDRKDVDGFCIVASDNHFASLARRLCKEECFVAILWSSGPNEPRASFKDECDAFVHVGELPRAGDPGAQGMSCWKGAVKESIGVSAQEGGWTLMSDVGNSLKAVEPDFAPSDYCHWKLFSLVKSCPEFETTEHPERVRLRPQ